MTASVPTRARDITVMMNGKSYTLGPLLDTAMDQLDRAKPDWRESVHLEKLSLDSWYFCILGQVFGNYDAGIKALYGKAPFDVTERENPEIVVFTSDVPPRLWLDALAPDEVV